MSAESPVDRRWKFPVLPFIVGEPPAPIDPRLIDLLSGFYVPDISDTVGRMYTVHNIRSLFETFSERTGGQVGVTIENVLTPLVYTLLDAKEVSFLDIHDFLASEAPPGRDPRPTHDKR